MDRLVTECNELRQAKGLLSIDRMLSLREADTTVYDPFSTLISNSVHLGAGTQIYPNCMILCDHGGSVSLGENNILYPSTVIQARFGVVEIGTGNTFGPGGCTASAMTDKVSVIIGDHGRYNAGANIYGSSRLGSGSQVLGQIAVDSCELGPGGSFREQDPDRRGAVLKGFGRAKNLRLAVGDVIQAFGVFEKDAIQRQVVYHPKEMKHNFSDC